MVFLIILAGIICIIGRILFANIKLKIYLSKKGYIVIKCLFFKFEYDFYGQDKIKKVTRKEKAKSDDKKADKPSEGYIKKIYKKHGVVDGTVQLLSIVKNIFSKIILLLSKAHMTNLNLKITVAGQDAATTALTYGAVSAVVYPAIGLINGIIQVDKQNINITADYDAKTPQVEFLSIIKLPVYKALSVGFSLIKDFL